MVNKPVGGGNIFTQINLTRCSVVWTFHIYKYTGTKNNHTTFILIFTNLSKSTTQHHNEKLQQR